MLVNEVFTRSQLPDKRLNFISVTLLESLVSFALQRLRRRHCRVTLYDTNEAVVVGIKTTQNQLKTTLNHNVTITQ